MKILPLHPQTEINGYLFYTIPYNILYTYPEYTDYLMEHYMQCFGYVDERNCMIFGYADGVGYHGDMFYDMGPLEINFHSYAVGLQLDIEKYIISSIDNNYYVTIFVDEYYIENRPAYKKNHHIHEILIHGYDNEKFYYFTFDRRVLLSTFQRSQTADAYKFGYSIYINMSEWEKVNWVYEKSIILLKPKQIQNQYTFSEIRFIENLKSYLNGEFGASYNSFAMPKEKCYIGVYNTNLIIDCIENLSPSGNVYIIYPSIHAWYESKKNLLNKIKYFYEKANYKNDIFISEYERSVVKQADAIRLSFIKYQQSGKLNKDAVKLLLNDIFISEKNILDNILLVR